MQDAFSDPKWLYRSVRWLYALEICNLNWRFNHLMVITTGNMVQSHSLLDR
jgi:hypothetical protein